MDTQWIKERLVLLEKTHDDVAKHLNKHRTVATKIINGEQALKINQIADFAQCLETTIPIILEKLGLDIPPSDQSHHQIPKQILAQIPVFSPKDIAQGYATSDTFYSNSNQYLDYLIFNSQEDSLLAMSVTDESMNRLVEMGSVIVIDRNQTDLIDHHLYIFLYNNSGLFRRFRKTFHDCWMEPDSLNPRFNPIFHEHWHQSLPLGKVIAIYSNKVIK